MKHEFDALEGNDWKNYLKAHKEIESITPIGEGVKSRTLYKAALYASKIKEGSCAEVGVFRGGSAKLVSGPLKKSKFYLFDTFTGVPEAHPAYDKPHLTGMFAETSLEEVLDLFDGNKNVFVIPGLFPDSGDVLDDEIQFKYVHIDMDIYLPTLYAIRFFWPRMVEGGVMIFDDYHFHQCPGIAKAVNGFFNKRDIRETSGQCYVIKGKSDG
jgi:hypothetical protein